MDSNPLLAMLKQAATGPPPTASASPAANAPHTAARPQSMSPPAQLQPVSIDDLFKNMNVSVHTQPAASPLPIPVPPPSAPAAFAQAGPVASPALAVSPPAQHQAKLLGMLSLGGKTSAPPAAAAPAAPAAPASAANSRPASGFASASSKEEERRNSLLNVLKSPPSAPVVLADPVVGAVLQRVPSSTPPGAATSPLGAAAALPALDAVVSAGVGVGAGAAPGAGAAAAAGADATVGAAAGPGSAPASDTGAIAPPLTSPPLAPPNALNAPKSIFDFVSPFDAFERPQSRALGAPGAGSGSGPATPGGHSSDPSPVGTKAATPVAPPKPETPPVAPSPPVPAPAPAPAAAAELAKARSKSPPIRQVAAAREQSRRTSVGSPGAKGKTDLGLPWLVTKVVKPNSDGTGPMSLAPGPITIDLSKPNVEALVNAPGTVQIQPTTIMKAENVGFQRGRTVAATKGWLAYTLARGRIRLIDRTSGARTLIQLDATNPVIDMAVSAETLAVVASDGSVSVFGVPASWDRDDPPCPLLFRMRAIDSNVVPAESALGDVNHLEFVHREGGVKPQLAIGGTEGVVLVHPYDWRNAPEADAREVLSSSKVLKTSGILEAFCLNATHQAIGLLSSSGYFSLYSVQNLNRVWHRQLPSSSPLPLSSVCFCETNILVGRANDTHFDLVQITVEIAVLATIKFVAAPPSPPALHFGHAAYSPDKETLVITPFARGSAYAFHYALKGQPPQRSVIKDNAHIQAFDTVAEYPLSGPVLSLVLGGTDDLELFYSTPQYINQASIDRSVLAARQAESVPPPKPKADKKKKQNRSVPQSPAAPPQAPVREDGPAARAATPSLATAPVLASATTPVAGGGSVTSDDLVKALKRTEDKMTSSFKQIVANELKAVATHLNKDKDLVATVSSTVSAHLETHLATIVQQELKRIPIEAQVRQAVSEQSSTLGRELERTIAPIVPRTIATVVQPAIERAARDAVEGVLVPAVMNATNNMYDQLADDLRTEMLQIRKDVNNDQGEALTATNAMLRSMASSISELQKQVAELSTQLERQRATTPASAPAPQAPAPAAQQATPPPPAPVPLHSAQQLEDMFLNVLHQGSSPAMLQLVAQQAPHLDAILPLPPAKSPLPQAVLLPLVHRLSAALAELPPHHPAFQTAATWLRRAVELVDSRDATIANYYPRAMPIVERSLGALIERLQHRTGAAHDPLVAAHIGVLRQTLEVLKAKAYEA